MKKSKLILVLTVATLAASFTFYGCEKAGNIVNDMNSALSQEHTSYQAVQGLRHVHGNRTVTVLNQWATALANLNYDVTKLISRLQNHPEERAQAQGLLSQLRAELDHVCGTSGEITVRVPSWDYPQAQDAANTARSSVIDLRSGYVTLFGTQPAKQSNFSLHLRVDHSLYDTYNDCVSAFAAYGLGHHDSSCANYATSRCTHQMNMGCVMQTLLLAGKRCTVRHRIPSIDARGKNIYTYSYDMADWVTRLGLCDSQQPVFKR